MCGRGHTEVNSNKDHIQKRHKVNDIDYDAIRNKFVNNNGRARSHEENALIIQSLTYFQKHGNSLDASCKILMQMYGGDHNVYHELWNYYIVMDSLDIELTHEKRGVQAFKDHEIDDFNNEDVDELLIYH